MRYKLDNINKEYNSLNKAVAKLNGPYRPVDWMSHSTWFDGIGRDQSKVIFAIRRLTDSKFIGYVQATNIHALFQCADLGILIGDEADRGHGVGQEALRLMRDFCWRDLNLSRLGLFVFTQNLRAINAYRKIGFEREGTLRRAWFVDGEFIDVDIMAAMKEGR